MFKSIMRLYIGVIFAGFFIWLIVRQVNLDELVEIFYLIKIQWFGIALLSFICGYACRIRRWQIMLVKDNPEVRWKDCAGPLLASYAVNNILPFRAGDVLRAFAFNKQLGSSSGIILATLFVERLLDLLVVLIMLGVALSFFRIDASLFVDIGAFVLIAIGGMIFVLLLFPQVLSNLAYFIGIFLSKIFPRFGKTLLVEIDKGLLILKQLSSSHTMPKLIMWSFMAWFSEGCVFWFAARALPSLSSALAGWLALSVGTLATLIPSTPGYLGTFDYFVIQAMTALGNNIPASTAYALLVHSLLWLPPTFIGGIYLLRRPIKHFRRKVL